MGVFDLLDESCQLKKSDDNSLLQKIRSTHKNNVLFQNPKMLHNQTFIIIHTAKEVEYTVTGFRDKNKDELSNITLKISLSSKMKLM